MRQATIIAAALLLLVGCDQRPGTPASGPLAMELRLDTLRERIGQPIPARLVFTNASKTPILLNRAFNASTPEGGCHLYFEAVNLPGERPEQVPAGARGTAPLPQSAFERVEAGGTSEVRIDLQKVLIFKQTGAYTIEAQYLCAYSGKLDDVWTGSVRARASLELTN